MWKLVQNSVCGRGHVKNGIPCQDKTFTISKCDVNAIVLADGAGSAVFSHFGAETVTKHIGVFLCENFSKLWNENDPNIVRKHVMNVCSQCLSEKSADIGCNMKELASTLLAVAVCEDKYLIIHLGDGVIGYVSEGHVKVASIPENGEFCNTTVFTTSNNAINYIKLLKGKLNSIEGFVMFSDGTESCFYNHQDKTINSGLDELFEDLKKHSEKTVEASLAETLDDIKLHTFDDCSIAAMMLCESTPDENIETGHTNDESTNDTEPIGNTTENDEDYFESETCQSERKKRIFWVLLLAVLLLSITFTVLYFVG